MKNNKINIEENIKKHPSDFIDECLEKINIIEYLSSEPTTDNFKAQTKLVSNLIENYLTYKATSVDVRKMDFHKKIVKKLIGAILSI